MFGSQIVRVLNNANYNVRAFVRKEADRTELRNLDYELFEGEITRQPDVNDAVKGCDFVIHAAARTLQAPSNLNFYRKPNIDSTKYLIEACKKNKVRRFVYISTANCFRNGTRENPGNEQSPFMSWLRDSGYAFSKYLAQQMVLKEVSADGFDAVIVNPTFIIGSNDLKRSSGQIFFYVLDKHVAFYPPGGKNFVDAEAAADGVLRAMKNGRTGECYLLAGENHTYLEFFKMVKKISAQRTVLIPIPKWIILFCGNLGSFIEKIFGTPIQLTRANAKMLCLGNYFTSSKAVKELGFKMIPTKQSIEKRLNGFHQSIKK